MPPIWQEVSDSCQYQTPEGKVEVRHAPEHGLLGASDQLHHPAVHDGAVADSGEAAAPNAEEEVVVGGGEGGEHAAHDAHRKQDHHGLSATKPISEMILIFLKNL